MLKPEGKRYMKTDIIRNLIVCAAVALAIGGVRADEWTDPDTGYTWTYRIVNDGAEIYGTATYDSYRGQYNIILAVSPAPKGALTIPSSLGGRPVTSIGDAAFAGCSGLTSITMPNSTTRIGNNTFWNCSGLTNVEIPDNVVRIGGAFYGCADSLFDTDSVPGLKLVDGWVIGTTENLSGHLDLTGVRGIASGAFQGCIELTSVTIPDSVVGIGSGAFQGCIGLRNVIVPGSVRDIDNSAFRDCSGLADENGLVIVRDVIYGYFGEGTSVVIPDGVTSIGVGAFQDCTNLTSVTIPNTVLDIGHGAFMGCGGLREMTIPGRVKSIGDSAFRFCSGLTSITIPNSVTSIGLLAFHGCSGLADKNGFVIVRGVLYSCHGGGQSLTIPNSVTNIGRLAFSYCRATLTNVTIPDGVTSIGWSAFAGCGNLLSVKIPDSVTCMEYEAFSTCRGLTNVVVGNGVTSIEDETFRNCSRLKNVTIGNGVTSISDSAFCDCYSLTTLILSQSALDICIDFDSVFPSWYGLSVSLDESVVDIGHHAFWCSSVTNVMISESVKHIGEEAFYWCSGLASVTIPYSVTNIENGAFMNCKNLHKAYVPDILEGFVDDSFQHCANDFEIEYYETSPHLEIITGGKIEIDIGRIGYTAKGLPTGLKYDAKKGVVSGAAKTTGEYEVTFSKKGEEDFVVMFIVRAEEVSVGCEGLSLGTFTSGVAGNASGIPFEIETETGIKSVAVSKLPAGMKYDAKARLITGGPTKPGEYAVTVTVTTKSGAKQVVTIPVTVAAAADGAVGTFNGFVKAADEVENIGTFQLTTTDAGKLTAKVTTSAGTYSFNGAFWDAVKDGIYSATLVTKKNEVLTLELDSTAGWDKSQLAGTFAAVSSKPPYRVVAHKNAFGKTWYFNAEGNVTDGWALSYAENAKAAALTVTLNADGSTKIAGKLGTLNVSASGYADVTGLAGGVIHADFAPVVSIKDGKTTLKCALSVRANLWFDRSNEHAEGVGTVKLMDK